MAIEFRLYEVARIESEAGWGSKVEDYVYFTTKERAEKYIKEFNAENNKPVTPSWYMYAAKADNIRVNAYEYGRVLSHEKSGKNGLVVSRRDQFKFVEKLPLIQGM